jgi:hypothetical protein
MPASKPIKLLSVRLPEPEFRRFKSIAAHRGVSLQAAVQEALAAWAGNLQETAAVPLDTLQGSLAGIDFQKLIKRERAAELRKDRRWA